MAKPIDHATREARLAAKLRENLHRRKAQARVQDTTRAPDLDRLASDRIGADRTATAENDSGTLPNSPPES